MTHLKLENISHRYGEIEVLKNITLELNKGDLLSILGASGSGKSTLLRTVAGFITPHQGTALINNEPIIQDGKNLVPTERRNIGMVFQA